MLHVPTWLAGDHPKLLGVQVIRKQSAAGHPRARTSARRVPLCPPPTAYQFQSAQRFWWFQMSNSPQRPSVVLGSRFTAWGVTGTAEGCSGYSAGLVTCSEPTKRSAVRVLLLPLFGRFIDVSRGALQRPY
jgi:hypothetical protein